MIPQTQRLLESAQSGERKLSTKERRQVVAYLMGTAADTTNTQMADWFGVTERTIRLDKKAIREEKSKLIKEDDVGLVIADILLDYERLINDIEKSARAAKLGSRTYLDHKTSQMELRLKTTKALQDLGYLPKNLGNMTVENFSYKAIVDKRTGHVTTRPVNLFDDNIQDAEFEDIKPQLLIEGNGRSKESSSEDKENWAKPTGQSGEPETESGAGFTS